MIDNPETVLHYIFDAFAVRAFSDFGKFRAFQGDMPMFYFDEFRVTLFSDFGKLRALLGGLPLFYFGQDLGFRLLRHYCCTITLMHLELQRFLISGNFGRL